MNPELPYLLSGLIALGGGIRKAGKFPNNGGSVLMATLALTIFASLTTGSRIAPLVRAVGFIILLAAVMAAITANKGVKKHG